MERSQPDNPVDEALRELNDAKRIADDTKRLANVKSQIEYLRTHSEAKPDTEAST